MAANLRSITAKVLNKSKFDAIVVGGGHNGLIAATYLQKAGLDTLVLEKRHVLGGAAVTEEMVPGYKFSRCSYVLSLLRPDIIKELDLVRHGLKWYYREHNSFTPLIDSDKSLIMSSCPKFTYDQIAQFSKKDADNFAPYEEWLGKYAKHMEKLLDVIPPGESLMSYARMGVARKLLPDIHEFIDVLTSPATKMLDRWFESEPLRATLATDAVIGAWQGPATPGSSYVLLHHVMGGVGEREGAWAYVEGGMGAVSEAIARAALEAGVTIKTEADVKKINVANNTVAGVELMDGTMLESSRVLSNATPKVTYLDILDDNILPDDFSSHIKSFDYTSPVFKLNVAMDKIPTFRGLKNGPNNTAGPQHQGTIHLNSESIGMVHKAFADASHGLVSDRPILEMTIPSSVDPTLAPEGHHVCSLFIQYAPYTPVDGPWDEAKKAAFSQKVFSQIDEYAPGFSSSVVGYDALAPPDLERIFGLTGGNIFHGSMGLDQLFTQRPSYSAPAYSSPVSGLYLCGSGAHPGGGVMGAPGKNCARVVLNNKRIIPKTFF